MTKLVKPANRALFVACVVLTGALAGAFVWAFFFLMDAGLGFLWNDGRLALSSGSIASRRCFLEVPLAWPCSPSLFACSVVW